MKKIKKIISLKKRWLAAHHHDDQNQIETDQNLLKINQLMREYNFHDWQTITVLVQINSNEYISGKIIQIGTKWLFIRSINKFFLSDQLIEINVYENIFGILSDNSPLYSRITSKENLILCKNEEIYQTSSDCRKKQKMENLKFYSKIKMKFYLSPRQSIRLFLPPWHDGRNISIL